MMVPISDCCNPCGEGHLNEINKSSVTCHYSHGQNNEGIFTYLPGDAWDGVNAHASVVMTILSMSMLGVPFTAPRP